MIEKNKLKVGRKGGAKRLTEMFKKIRQTRISQDVYDIINESAKKQRENTPDSAKKIAKSKDVEI